MIYTPGFCLLAKETLYNDASDTKRGNNSFAMSDEHDEFSSSFDKYLCDK